MRFVTEDEMQEREDKLRAEWRTELCRALEAMREQEDLGASYRWGLNAALNTLDATLPQQPDPQPIDPLSPAAFKGRTTPDGKPVRWVAWDEHGCCEYSTDDVPDREDDVGLCNPPRAQNYRPDLDDPARAGQTLWVGQGPDPRKQEPTPDYRELRDDLLRDIMPNGHFEARQQRAVDMFVGTIEADWRMNAKPLTLADIPAELRAEIEAAERERVAQWFDVDKWEWEAGRVRALGPREVKP